MTDPKEWGVAADLRALFSFFARMLSDDTGNISSKRWIAVFTGTVVPSTWAYLCIKKDAILAIPWDILLYVLAAAGIVALGKMGEQKPQPPGGP